MWNTWQDLFLFFLFSKTWHEVHFCDKLEEKKYKYKKRANRCSSFYPYKCSPRAQLLLTFRGGSAQLLGANKCSVGAQLLFIGGGAKRGMVPIQKYAGSPKKYARKNTPKKRRTFVRQSSSRHLGPRIFPLV